MFAKSGMALKGWLGLLNSASVAINGSKFKAVNNRDRNFTQAKVERRRGAEHPGHPATDGRPQGIGAGLCLCHQACDTLDRPFRSDRTFISPMINPLALTDDEGLWSVESRSQTSAKAF
jgi:hypothetical protein